MEFEEKGKNKWREKETKESGRYKEECKDRT